MKWLNIHKSHHDTANGIRRIPEISIFNPENQ